MLLYLFKNSTAVLVRDGNNSQIVTMPDPVCAVVKIGTVEISILDGVGEIPNPPIRGAFHVSCVHGERPYEAGIVQFDNMGHPMASPRSQKVLADCLVKCQRLEERQTALEDRILTLENNFKYRGLDFLIQPESEEK